MRHSLQAKVWLYVNTSKNWLGHKPCSRQQVSERH